MRLAFYRLPVHKLVYRVIRRLVFQKVAEVVFALLALFLVMLLESGRTDTPHAVPMPESPDKIHPFLGPVRSGRAGKQIVFPRIRHVPRIAIRPFSALSCPQHGNQFFKE